MKPVFENVLLIVITQAFTILALYLKEYYFKQKLSSPKLSPIDRSAIFLKLGQTCGRIRKDLKANGVYIAYFHNGDYYKNGLSIDKFTVVAEDYDEGTKMNYIVKYQMTTINYINYIYHRLLTDSRYYMEDVPNTKMSDVNYKDDLTQRGVISSYSFLIKDYDEKPIGFISIEFTSKFKLTVEQEHLIWKHQLSTYKSIKNITSK